MRGIRVLVEADLAQVAALHSSTQEYKPILSPSRRIILSANPAPESMVRR
jgi:hypothetical protein